jgi:hypothetical protein
MPLFEGEAPGVSPRTEGNQARVGLVSNYAGAGGVAAGNADCGVGGAGSGGATFGL